MKYSEIKFRSSLSFSEELLKRVSNESSLSNDEIVALTNEIKKEYKEVLTVKIKEKINKEILELVDKYDIVYGSLGFHPTELNDFDYDKIEEFLKKNKYQVSDSYEYIQDPCWKNTNILYFERNFWFYGYRPYSVDFVSNRLI